MDRIVITPATPADVAWMDLHQPAAGMPDVHRRRLAVQAAGQGVYLAARIHGRIVGSVLLHFRHRDPRPGAAESPDCAFVEALGVEPEDRRRGVARALMREAERQARAAGRIGLSVGVDNAAARALYRSLGYAQEGLDDYWVCWPWLNRATGETGEEGEMCSFWVRALA